MSARLALAAAVVILAGCDRFEAPTGLPPSGGPSSPPATVQDVYVKGVSTLSLGQAVEFRTETVQGAAFYRWSAQGIGGVEFAANPADTGLGRIVTIGGTTSGPITVEAIALDAQRNPIARGTRDVTVR